MLETTRMRLVVLGRILTASLLVALTATPAVAAEFGATTPPAPRRADQGTVAVDDPRLPKRVPREAQPSGPDTVVGLEPDYSGSAIPVSEGPSYPRVYAPYVPGDMPFIQLAVFWFGRITPTENYADVRVGYNDSELLVHVAVVDRLLWYDESPSASDLESWDAVTLLLRKGGNTGSLPDASAYKFVGQLNWWEGRDRYQAAYQGDGVTWQPVSVPFTAETGWRGNAPLDSSEDRGWTVTYHIPFASLGLSGPPVQGSIWGMGLVLHDRDDAAGTAIADKAWPSAPAPDTPSAWGQLAFGAPQYTAPSATPGGTVAIREKLNGVTVVDADVGGSSICGGSLDFWTEWPQANYAGKEFFNIQNQIDISDWPCFSKTYITFPLGPIPAGKVILGARLILHQFGNAGGGSWGEPPRSLIQALTAMQDWSESTINWNNAPLAKENVAATWVDPMSGPIEWPGVPWEWDVTYAAAQAYQSGEPLRMVMYSADTEYHSGKYFVTSETGDWNELGRPTLEVTWGNPTQTPTFVDVPFSHPYYDEIETLYRAGYTAGCNTDPLMYCPDATMNRSESAVFVERGIHSATYDPPTPTTQVFADLALDSWAAKWVNGLWQDQYTAGCGTNPLVYCPWQGHSRAEGCVFYLRMMRDASYEPPQPAVQTFSDVPLDVWYANWVQAAYDAGLIKPCETIPELRFCPDGPLSRDLAAYMMVKAKGLALP